MFVGKLFIILSVPIYLMLAISVSGCKKDFSEFRDTTWSITETHTSDLTLKLNLDGSFKHYVSSEGGRTVYTGRYKLEKMKYQFEPIEFPPNYSGATKFIISCNIKESATSIYIRYFMNCDNGWRMFNQVIPVVDGQTRNWNNVKFITFKSKGRSTANLKIREQPDIKSNSLTVLGNDYEKMTSLPKSWPLYVIGKTTNKQSVGKWFNYWYLIEATNEDYGRGHEQGWVFGEFVELD